MLLLCTAAPARAEPLGDIIPNLFGGTLNTTIDQTFGSSSQQQPSIVRRFGALSAQLSAARSQVPLPSASGAFSFAWDRELDTFVRFEQSLGSAFAERAQTLGRGRFTVGLAYQYVDFSTLDGEPLSSITSSQPAFSRSYLDALPPSDQILFGDDVLLTTLDMTFRFHLFSLSAAYGLTDNIDISLALTINSAEMKGHALAQTLPCQGPSCVSPAVGLFTNDQPGVIVTDGRGPVCSNPYRCAQDSFDESATGTGDLFLRVKWHVVDTWLADLTLAQVLTLPTGNADELLGFHDPTWTPLLIASKNFGPVSPHVNLGYAFRSSEDVSQALWIAGADVMATRWLTLSADFLGYHDDDRDGINDDVIQSAVGFRVNPWGGLVVGANFQFPVNRDGLRADVIYTGQVEYNF